MSDDIELENVELDDCYEPDSKDLTSTCNSGGTMPLHHAMHPYIKETSKYERHISEDVKDYIDRTLNDLLGTVVGSVSAELNQDIDSTKKNNCNEGHLTSMHPTHDKRKNDARLKAYWQA